MTTPILIEGSIYQPDGSAIARVGQTAVLDFQAAAPNAVAGPFVPVALDGRFFVQRLFGRDGTLLAEVEASRPDVFTVRFILPMTAGLIAPAKAADLTHAIVELLAGAEDEVLVRPFSVRALRIGVPAALMTVGPAERLMVRYVGSTGLSAAQQLKEAGLIETATGDALATWLRAPAVAAATDVNVAGATHLAAVNAAGVAQTAAVNTAGGIQVTAVNTAGGTQTAAVNAAGVAQTATVNTAGGTQTAAVNAAGATQTATVIEAARAASFTAGTYPNNAATAVPRGVTAVVLTAPGAGYTNGLNYVGTFTGGAGAGARFRFDVVAAAVTNVRGIEPGYGYTSNPVAVFTAAGAGAGATATVTASVLRLSGEFYWVAEPDAATYRLYQNAADVSTAVVPALFRPYAGQVPVTASAVTSSIWNLAIQASFAVTGTSQTFRGIAPGANGAGALTMAIPGVYAGVQTAVILPTGEAVPQNTILNNYPFQVTPATIGGVNRLILTWPVFQPAPPVLHLIATGTAGAPILTMTAAAVRVPADFVIDLEFEAIFDATGAGVTASLRDSLGTTILTNMPIRERDLTTTPPAGRWLAGDRVRVRRVMPSGVVKIVSVSTRNSTSAEAAAGTGDIRPITPAGVEAHFATKREGLARYQIATALQLPSVLAPIVMTKDENHRILVRLLPPASAYRNGRTRRYDDHVIFEMINVGEINPGQAFKHLWVITSIITCFSGQKVQHTNYSWNALVGASTNTRQVPSIFEPVIFGGKPGDPLLSVPPAAGTDVNFPGSGPMHGRIAAVSLSLAIFGGIKNGLAIAEGANVRDTFRTGEVIECSQVDFSSVWTYLTPDGSTLLTAVGLHRFAPHAGLQCLTNFNLAFAADRVVSFGYAQMFPNRLADKVQATLVDGSLGPVRTCGLGNGATIDLGQARVLTAWNTDHPNHRVEADVHPAYVPFRRNGVQAAWPGNAFGVDGEAGFKGYWPTHVGSLDVDAEGGNEISTYCTYGGVYTQ